MRSLRLGGSPGRRGQLAAPSHACRHAAAPAAAAPVRSAALRRAELGVALPSLGSPIREALDQAFGDESYNITWLCGFEREILCIDDFGSPPNPKWVMVLS